MKILSLNIYKQKNEDCAVATVASVANYFNNNITYSQVCSLAEKTNKGCLANGMFSGDIGILLNNVGFNKIQICTSDIELYDFSWSLLEKKELCRKIKQASIKNKDYKQIYSNVYNFLKFKKENSLIVDLDFKKHIIESIDKDKPVLVTIDLTILHKDSKVNNGKIDTIMGSTERHEVIAVGYDEQYICIVNPHKDKRRNSMLKYIDKGIFMMKWEHFISISSSCDLHLIKDEMPIELNIKNE